MMHFINVSFRSLKLCKFDQNSLCVEFVTFQDASVALMFQVDLKILARKVMLVEMVSLDVEDLNLQF